ncbi:MAG: hypothetical protein ACJ763_14065 [Bdellovibrionia bacterium]
MKVSKSWSVLFLGFALMSQSALAGHGVDSSGGGNAIVCFDLSAIATRLRQEKLAGSGFIADSDISHITSVELLDVHKAKTPSIPMGSEDMVPVTHRVIESRPGETPAQYSKRLEKRFENYYPVINDLLKQGKAYFKSIKPYAHGLKSIDDVNSVENFSTETCVKATIIGQFTEPTGRFIAYDSRIFSLPTNIFSASNQALSYWHEYLYALTKYAVKAQSSDSTQTLLGALITEGISLSELNYLVKATLENNFYNPYYVSGDYASRFVDRLNADLVTHKLQTSYDFEAFYSVKDQKGFLESEEEAKIRVEKMAKSDPRYLSTPVAALQLYNEKWKPVLYSTPQIAREKLSQLDEIITESLKKFKPSVECGVYQSTVTCDVKLYFDLSGTIHDVSCSGLFNVVLPNGDEL